MAAPADPLSAVLTSTMMPHIASLNSKLVELQQQQQILVASVAIHREEISNGTEEWLQARAVLDRIPEYQAKLARLHKAMVNGHAQLLRTNKAALVLRDRLEEKDAETRARRAAEQAAYQSVSAAAADAGGASGPA